MMATRNRGLAGRGDRPGRAVPGGGAVATPAMAVAGAPPSSAGRALALTLLAAATLAIFAGVRRNDWLTYDDPSYVYENPRVNHGLRLDDALWFLSHSHSGNWHPLTSWTHMLDVQLFGLAPVGPHAVNLALHTVNAVLLVLVLYRLTGAWWRCLLVGALFALHPLRVESVAWISERKDVLSGLFFMLTLEAYRRWVERPSGGRWTLLLVTYALGLMAKPMLVTVPFVLTLLDVWPIGRMIRKTDDRARGDRRTGAPARSLPGLLGEKWPLFALAGASAVVTVIVQRQSGAMALMEVIPLGRRFTNALLSYWWYVGKTLWPSRLAPHYPMHPSPALAWVLAGAGLVAASSLVAAQARKRPYLAVGWLWYVGTLVPVIGLIQVGAQACADRYSYLPTIGLAIAFAWAIGEGVERSRPGRVVVACGCALALVGLSACTVRQVALWKNSSTLFTHTLAVTTDNPIAHWHLGDALLKAGQTQQAVEHYEEVVRLIPDDADAHSILGVALGSLGHYDEAIAQFQTAIRLGSDARYHYNLGLAYGKQGRVDDAIEEYRAALRLDPDDYMSLVYLAEALDERGLLVEAEPPLRHALELRPTDQDVRRQLATVLVRTNRIVPAIGEFETILRQNPDDVETLVNLSWLRATCADSSQRNGAEAVRLAERALHRSPEPVAVQFGTLAAAYGEAGRFPEAIRACEQAIEMARAAGQPAESRNYERQLEHYRAGRAFHFDR